MTTKKLVSQQQLYGVGPTAKKCLKQSTGNRRTNLGVPGGGGGGGTLTTQEQCQHTTPRCHLTRSNNQLQNLELYGSYGSLPRVARNTCNTGAAPEVPQFGTCRRHFTGSGRWYPPPQQQHEEGYCYYHQQNQQGAATHQQQQHHAQQQVPTFPNTCTCGGDRSFQQPARFQQQYQYPRTPIVGAKQQQQQQQHHHHQHHQPQQQQQQQQHDIEHKPIENGYYFGYDHGATHVTDEEDSAFPAIHDFHLLHRNIPALRRTGVDTAAIRQYFYPDGGWGWIICGMAFLVHILTTGLQLSYGLLLFYAIQHLGHSSGVIEWVGALSWSVSLMVTPFVIAFCRKKSTRLLAVVGGLVLPLGILFTSFANELGQIIFSYGFVFGIGVSMVRESSTIMVGNYFKRRRQFVEMIAMSGEGVGIALFSVILKEGVGKAGWRYGLQIIAALVAISFLIGFLYRPASLYHPQRRAIQHLKNQRKKMRENKFANAPAEQTTKKYFFLDISALKSVTVRLFIMIAAVAAFGIYTPMFTMSLSAAKEGSDIQDLVLLQTFLGMATALGVIISGALIRNPIKVRTLVVNKLVVSHIFLGTIAISILILSSTMGYRGLCILSWTYGIGFGGFRYSFKMLALEQIKLKQFSKAWGLIRGIECIPVLGSVPLTIFLNDYSLDYGRAGYYICSAATAIAGIITFFLKISYSDPSSDSSGAPSGPSRKYVNGAVRTVRSMSTHHIRPNYAAEYLYNGCDYPVANLLNRSCISLNQVEDENTYRHLYGCHRFRSPYHHVHQYDEARGMVVDVDDDDDDEDVTQRTPKNLRYNFGQGSVGARSGRRLQKSLSFIQQQQHEQPHQHQHHLHHQHHHHQQPQQHPYLSSTQQLTCNCQHQPSQYEPFAHWSQHDIRRTLTPHDESSVMCTCGSPTSMATQFQNSRSRSVPEGLSTISQQCTCRAAGLQSKEIVYLPRTPLQSRDLLSGCAHHGRHAADNDVLMHRLTPKPATSTRCHQQQQQQQQLQKHGGSSKAIHFIEQITTSV